MGDTGGVLRVVADKLDECVVLPPAVDAVEVAAATAGAGAVAWVASGAVAGAASGAVAAAVAAAMAAAAAVMVVAPLLLLPMDRKVLRDFFWLL